MAVSLFDFVLTRYSATIFYVFPVAFRPDSKSWPSVTELHDHTHWTHRTRYGYSGRVISPTQGLLPDNTQHSQETDFYAPDGIRTRNPRKQSALDRVATGIGIG